jgi:hypothetical protein
MDNRIFWKKQNNVLLKKQVQEQGICSLQNREIQQSIIQWYVKDCFFFLTVYNNFVPIKKKDIQFTSLSH